MGTWADIIASGTGTVEYRLVIEGSKYEFCTSAEMEGALSAGTDAGKYRVNGLQRSGLGFAEKAYLAGAELDISINAIEIVETSGQYLDAATEIFSALPATLGYLTASATAAAATLAVNDLFAFATGQYVHIGTEVVYVSNGAANPIAVTRGMWGTTAQAHNRSVGIGAREVPLLDGVAFWKNRRVWLYAHGDTELGTASNGTLVWRGRVGSTPSLAGGEATTWSLNVESRWEFLEQEIGTSSQKERKLRGIYYAGNAPFWINVRRSPTATSGGLTADAVVEIGLAGFWETNAAFVEDLVDALNANASIVSWGHKFSGHANTTDGHWELLVTVPATPRCLEIWGGSPVDGYFGYPLLSEADFAVYGTARASSGIYTVEGGKTYVVTWSPSHYGEERARELSQLRTVPRHCSVTNHLVADSLTYPRSRVYLDDVTGLTTDDSIQLSRSSGEGDEAVVDFEFHGDTDTIDTSSGYVELTFGGTTPPSFAAVGTDSPSIKVTKRVGAVAGTDLAGFRDALIASAPDVANDAAGPWVLSDDLASWTTAVSAATRGRAFLARRDYRFYKGVRLTDVLKHEARLYSLFFYLDADFKIAVRRLTIETAAVATDLHATGAKLLTDNGFGEIRDAADGLVNVVEISRGYDPVEDDYTLSQHQYVNVGSVSAAKRRAVLSIEPKVTAIEGEITELETIELGNTVTGLFGSALVHVVIEVPLTFWGVKIGDSILITSEQLPLDGARKANTPSGGMNARRAIVVAREWFLDEPRGRFTCMITGLNVAGYAPSARVSSASGSLTTWVLTVEANRYAPSGAQDCAYFVVGDKVAIVEYDATGPTVRNGTVTGVNTSTNEISVTFTANWGGIAGGVWDLTYQAGTSPVQDSQQEYAFIAGGSLRISYAVASAAGARLFAP